MHLKILKESIQTLILASGIDDRNMSPVSYFLGYSCFTEI